MTGGGSGGAGACAVCKHQRRKCEPNCELAAYFPANRMNDFRALHLVFGVANLTKLIKANATEAARRRAAETLTWEARWRERDPPRGYREVSCLRRDNAALRAENAALRRQADQSRAAPAPPASGTPRRRRRCSTSCCWSRRTTAPPPPGLAMLCRTTPPSCRAASSPPPAASAVPTAMEPCRPCGRRLITCKLRRRRP